MIRSTSLIDVCLLRFYARGLAKRISTRRPACGLLAANDAYRFPLANRDRTFSRLLYPPNGGGPKWVGGALDQAAIEPWNGHLVRQRTAAIPGDQDRAGTIWGAGRTCSAPRHLV